VNKRKGPSETAPVRRFRRNRGSAARHFPNLHQSTVRLRTSGIGPAWESCCQKSVTFGRVLDQVERLIGQNRTRNHTNRDKNLPLHPPCGRAVPSTTFSDRHKNCLRRCGSSFSGRACSSIESATFFEDEFEWREPTLLPACVMFPLPQRQTFRMSPIAHPKACRRKKRKWKASKHHNGDHCRGDRDLAGEQAIHFRSFGTEKPVEECKRICSGCTLSIHAFTARSPVSQLHAPRVFNSYIKPDS